MLDTTFPLPSALASPGSARNATVFGKDAMFAFQRIDDSANRFVDTTTDIDTEASWTTFLTASDDTKIILTPFLEDVEYSEPDRLEGSENHDGAAVGVGPGPVTVSAVIRNPTQKQVSYLRDLGNEEKIGLYVIDANGHILSRTDGTNFYPIKISVKTFVATGPYRGTARADQFMLKITFALRADWFEDTVVTPPASGFDPLCDLEQTES